MSQPIPYGSIRIQYSGKPGSLMAEVASVDQGQDLVVDAKLQNEGNGWAGSGANPWHLDSHIESMVFLTNMGDRPERVGFKVWASGTVYYLTKLKLAPHETRIIDLRKLRDAQEPDYKGNKIPAGATDGSVLWNRADNLPVMGRVAVIDRQGGVASAYDCCTCQCGLNYNSMAVTPANESIAAGQQCQMTATENNTNCNGAPFPLNVTNDSTGSSTATQVATVSSAGLVTTVAGGTTGINATMSGTACYQWNMNTPPYNCQCPGPVTPQGGTPLTVPTPGYVFMYSNQAGTYPCTDSLGHKRTMPSRVIYYQVWGNSNPPVPINQAGMSVAETISFSSSSPCKPSNGCGQEPTASSWTTDSNGIINSPGDTVVNCSTTCVEGNECTEVWEQTFTVNGKSVQIINGTTTGARNCWSADRKSGRGGTTTKYVVS